MQKFAGISSWEGGVGDHRRGLLHLAVPAGASTDHEKNEAWSEEGSTAIMGYRRGGENQIAILLLYSTMHLWQW